MFTPLLTQFSKIEPITVSDWRGGLLIRSTNWLGDALITLPAVYQIKRLLPDRTCITMLTPKNLAPVWKACPFVDSVIPMEDKHITDKEIDAVRKAAPAAAMVFPNSFGSALDIFKTGVPIRIGRSGRWRSLLLTKRLREWPRGENIGKCHQLSYYLELASVFGDVAMSTECPSLQVKPDYALSLGLEPGKYMVIAPGAAYGPAKQWPADYFQAIASDYADHGGRVVVIGGKKDTKAAYLSCRDIPGALDLSGKTDLEQLMSVLSQSRLVIANDSGPMHLSAALGKDGFAIFGSTDPVATGPIGGNWTIIASEASCRPCFQRECPLEDNPYHCLRNIRPTQLIEQLHQLY